MVSTNETNIHLWVLSKRNKNKPRKDDLLKEILDILGTTLDLHSLNVGDLIELLVWLKNPTKLTQQELKSKNEFQLYFKQQIPALGNITRLSMSTLRSLYEVLHEHANKK